MQLDDAFYSKHEVSGEIFYAALLHDHPELLDDCCELINSEWKRSYVARLRSISGSSCNFPTSVLLMKLSNKPEIIGHCKLTKISHSAPVIFAETVVIHQKYRGRGLGRLLMQKAEDYVKSKGIKYLYLTTMDQELFYKKLGYLPCEPINVYGGQLHDFLLDNDKSELLPKHDLHIIQKSTGAAKSIETSLPVQQTVPISPPPPPPPPPMTSLNPKIIHLTNKKTHMRKKLM